LFPYLFILNLFCGVYSMTLPTASPFPTESTTLVSIPGLDALIPRPVSILPGSGRFVLDAKVCIRADVNSTDVAWIAQNLAESLRQATGAPFPVKTDEDSAQTGAISLSLSDEDAGFGEEGYRLEIRPDGVELAARCPAGLFYATQTLRQMLPRQMLTGEADQNGTCSLPAVSIRDFPRYGWRGVMLDVARHFFGPADIRQIIDQLAFYKINRLHLHLTDDQGWRLEIHSWPELTRTGSTSAVGGDPGGFYTQAEYAEIVAYAARRGITIVPEVDTPGHTNAALASYAELNGDGKARELYTGTKVGFSTLCIEKDVTYRFLTDVMCEIAALTPGEFIHIGGDEAASTPEADYRVFIGRIQEIVRLAGKRMIGWEETTQVNLLPTSVVQIWNGKHAEHAVAQSQKLIVSLAQYAYLDMKYDASTSLGLDWAGVHEVKDFYDWEPTDILPGVREENILGVEGALWTETVRTRQDVEFLTFPRLPGLAEVAWSPAGTRNWEEYRQRLANSGASMNALGIHFYRSPQVWKES
jgi:hexosaminidase